MSHNVHKGALTLDPSIPTIEISPVLPGLTTRYVQVSGFLFRDFPCKNVINQYLNQGDIGDCWLISGLIAIANTKNGCRFLHQMMTEKIIANRSYIFVRLFYDSGHPVYLKMEKSIPFWGTHSQNQYGCRYNSKLGLWPLFIEKAITYMLNTNTVHYSNLVGNQVSTAFKFLLGIQTNKIEIHNNNLGLTDYATASFLEYMELFAKRDIQDSNYLLAFYKEPLIQQFGTETAAQAAFTALMSYNSKKQYSLYAFFGGNDVRFTKKIFNYWHWRYEKVINKIQIIRYEHLVDYFSEMEPSLKNNWLQFFIKTGLFPGKRGTMMYSTKELKFFNYIQTLLKNNKPIAVSCIHNYHAPNYRKNGLFSPHSYAILGVELNPHRVILANPWGNTGRGYRQEGSKTVAVEIPNGIFSCDLHDFIKHFATICTTTETIPDPRMPRITSEA